MKVQGPQYPGGDAGVYRVLYRLAIDLLVAVCAGLARPGAGSNANHPRPIFGRRDAMQGCFRKPVGCIQVPPEWLLTPVAKLSERAGVGDIGCAYRIVSDMSGEDVVISGERGLTWINNQVTAS